MKVSNHETRISMQWSIGRAIARYQSFMKMCQTFLHQISWILWLFENWSLIQLATSALSNRLCFQSQILRHKSLQFVLEFSFVLFDTECPPSHTAIAWITSRKCSILISSVECKKVVSAFLSFCGKSNFVVRFPLYFIVFWQLVLCIKM